MQLYILGIVCMLLVLDFPIIGTEVVDSFNNCSEVFFKKQPPSFLNGSCLTGEESYKMICQVYKNHCRFATLYDTRHKIPVFSAYKYKGTTDFNLPDNPPAMVEPQVIFFWLICLFHMLTMFQKCVDLSLFKCIQLFHSLFLFSVMCSLA